MLPSAFEGPFELAVLDWMMPEMDKLTVYRHLRTDPHLSYILPCNLYNDITTRHPFISANSQKGIL